MNPNRTTETIVEAWLSDGFTAQPDAEQMLDNVRVAVADAPQRRYRWWPFPTKSGPTPARGSTMFSAVKFVVAGAIVALFGGFLLSGVLTHPSDESVPAASTSASPKVELPLEIPDDIPSGQLDTPLGPARWVHLSGDAETLPDILRPVPVPGGYVSLDDGHHSSTCPSGQSPCIYPAELWFSPDLIEWTRRPLPVDIEVAHLTNTGGEYWLNVNDEEENEDGSLDPPALWRSTDALEWNAVDLSGMEPPPPAVVEWSAHLPPDAVVVVEDAILVQMGYGAQVGKSLLGLPPEPEGEWARLERTDGGSYRVLGPYDDEHGRVRFEETSGGLRVIDDETDAELTVVEGISMDFIDRWAASGEPPFEYRLALLRDGRVDSVELPEARPEGHSFTLVETDDGFIALQPGSEGLIQTWTSPDGETWAVDEVLGDDPGEPVATHGVWNGPDGLVAWSFDDDTQVAEIWESSDGIDWQHHIQPPGDLVARLGSGWIGLDGAGLTIYPGGPEGPEVVDLQDLRMKLESAGEGGHGMAPIGANAIAHGVAEDGYGQRRDHWIITFDDLLE